MTVTEVRHLSVTVNRSAQAVYDFAAKPENLPRWASGLGSGPRHVGGEEWEVRSPEGPVGVRFTPPNPFGVLDHTVTVSPGVDVYVPMRVVANGSGSEVILTLFRVAQMTDEKFAADAAWVGRDLTTLKDLLEQSPRGEETD
ncbi:MAG: hypothetical protein JWO31_4227 [Phycisphaerales bacterium]|nr:hypothetical protein [Phycisphaerales bacterium]